MPRQIGYHASHEQFPPEELLHLVAMAEKAGFDTAKCSDHFHPWTAERGHSGHAWSWLGAAMQATRLPFGIVSAPGYRYHPAILAQAAATLSRMFEDRLWVAIGSGEAINEAITGEPWPDKALRTAKLAECHDVMRRLLEGETVTHRGLISVIEARLYSLPARMPLILGAAASPETAAGIAEWAEGLLTVGATPEELRRVVTAYRSAGGRGDIHVQVALSWAREREEAEAQARSQWAGLAAGADVNWDVRHPADFDCIARIVSSEAIAKMVFIETEPDRYVEWLRSLFEAGASAIHLHQVGADQIGFIETFGAEVLPRLRPATPG